MHKLKFIIDNKIPFIKGAFENFAEVIYLPGNEIGPEDVKEADALIIRTRTKCNQALLDASKIQFIATATIGYDHIDTAYCKEKGIQWTNAPGCNSSSVEQYIVSALLFLADKNGFKPEKKTVGIIGVGNVGRKVEKACKALGYKVICNDPPRERIEGSIEFTSLDELLAQSDIVSMHVPLISEGIDSTVDMADKVFFEKMKPGACFINSSRGEVVNEQDLKNSMSAGNIGDAVLDVFQNEPLLDLSLLHKLTLATPHIAGYSMDGKANGSAMSVQAISKFFKLGLEQWQVENIPSPENPEIFVDGGQSDSIELIREVYNQCYDISDDHNNLRDEVDKFESLRGNYKLRREPAAYRIRLYNDDEKYRNILETLGFSVIRDSCF